MGFTLVFSCNRHKSTIGAVRIPISLAKRFCALCFCQKRQKCVLAQLECLFCHQKCLRRRQCRLRSILWLCRCDKPRCRCGCVCLEHRLVAGYLVIITRSTLIDCTCHAAIECAAERACNVNAHVGF